MRSVKQQFIHHSIGLAVGLFIALVGAVFFDTFINTEPPFHTTNDIAFITSDGHTSIFRYKRELFILKDFEGTVHRYLAPVNSEYPQYTVPSSTIKYKYRKEAYPVDRPFSFEPALKPGIWCLRATMHWRPTFSLTQHSKEASQVCAEAK